MSDRGIIGRKVSVGGLQQEQHGLTRGEGLIVLAIMGILLVLSVLSLQSGREKGRDSKRLSDIRQIQAALEIYYQNHNEYPRVSEDAGKELVLGPLEDKTVQCLTESGFLRGTDCTSDTRQPPYMGHIPGDPSGKRYVYRAADEGKNYGIEFQLEGRVADLPGQTPLCAGPKTDIQKRTCQ